MRRAIFLSIAVMASLLLVPTQAIAASDCGLGADFDGDGRDDLAIGVPGETGATDHPGGVHIIYGSSSGLTASGDQLLYQGAGGLAGTANNGDRFGAALATGDFDSDGFSDLAVGIPGEFVNVGNAGAVQIIYGSSAGLTGTRDVIFHQNSSGVTDQADVADRFGSALAACDFDADGRDDLAIGVPREQIGSAVDEGAVHVLYGTSTGLSASGDQLIYQDTSGIADSAETGDMFGTALTAGDFDADGRDDLAVGIPNEGIVGALDREGAVHVIYGSSTGLSASGDQFWHQDVSGMADAAEDLDQFGFAVAAGDFDNDGRDDLAIGIPFQGIQAFDTGEGALHVLYGSVAGLSASGDQFFHQDITGFTDEAEPFEQFGFAVAAGDRDGDGRDDLAVGVPFQDVASHVDNGSVHQIYGSSTGLSASGDEVLFFAPDTSDYLGSALSTADFDADGRDDLAVGIQGKDIPFDTGNDQGGVVVFYGTNGLTATQGWTQDHPGITDAAAPEPNQYFGGALPGSRFINLDG